MAPNRREEICKNVEHSEAENAKSRTEASRKGPRRQTSDFELNAVGGREAQQMGENHLRVFNRRDQTVSF